MAEDKVYLLTQEAYNKMKEELAHREGELREEIAHKIAVARAEGDLSEDELVSLLNRKKIALGQEESFEGRITELTVKLRDSKIIENAPEGTVGEGSVVTIELNGNEMTYVLGSRDIVAGTDYDIMTPDSPIGKAIEGAKVGDVVSYTAPNGRELSVTVKAAKPLA